MYESYMTVADKAYEIMKQLIEQKEHGNKIAIMGHMIITNYLKYIIFTKDTTITPKTRNEISITKSLHQLLSYIERRKLWDFSEQEQMQIAAMQGYYIDLVCPGNDKYNISLSEEQRCINAVETVHKIMMNLKN